MSNIELSRVMPAARRESWADMAVGNSFVRGESKRYLSHLFYYKYLILLKSVCPLV